MDFSFYKISISGLNLHKIISYFQDQNIHLANVERVNHKRLVCNISKNDYYKIKKAGVLKKYKVKIIKKYGFEGALKYILTKIGLLVGITVITLTTINLTSSISSVSINTANHSCQNGDKCILNEKNISQIYDSLENLGIKKGNSLKNIPTNKTIKTELIINHPQISEVYVEKKGVNVVVNILEAKLPTNEIKTDLIASHSGIVIKTDVSSGSLKVKLGDIVLKGETLIKNTGTPAKGTVVLRAFYHESTIYNETQITYERTGKTQHINSLSLFNIKLNNSKKTKFSLYETEEKHKYSSVNTLLPIKVHQTTYYELKKNEQIVPFELNRQSTLELLKEKTLLLVPQNAQVRNTTFTTKQEGSRFLVTCYVETYLTLSI